MEGEKKTQHTHTYVPAVHDVRTIGCSLEVGQSPDEGNDRVGMVGNAKVRPTSVVELFDFTSVVASTETEGPYGIVGQLLNLYQHDRQISKTQTTNFRPVLVTLSLCRRERGGRERRRKRREGEGEGGRGGGRERREGEEEEGEEEKGERER